MKVRMVGLCIVFMPCIFLAAGRLDEEYGRREPQPSHVHQYILTGFPGIPGTTTPLEAIARGGLDGTQGGVGLLVKSLIIAIPTALYLAYNKLCAWYACNPEVRVLQEENLVASQTRLVIAHTKYAAALNNWIRVRQQLQKELESPTNTHQESLDEIWQRVGLAQAPPSQVQVAQTSV